MRRALKQTASALRHPNYRRWAIADFVSVTGTWMQHLGLSWLVLTMTGSPGLLGLSVLFQTVPRVVLGSWAGAIADRFPARRVLFVTQSCHAVLAVSLAFAAWQHAPLAAIYAIALSTGVVSVFDGPALGRFGSQLVGRRDLGNALSLGSIFSSAGRILGMSLAGVLVGVIGEGPLFLLNALSFAGVFLVIARIRSEAMFPLQTSPKHRAGTLAGLRYVAGHRPLLVLFVLAFALSSLGRNYQVTMAAMSRGALHAGAAGYGGLSVVFAVGTVLGGLLAAARPELTLRLLLGVALASSVMETVSGLAPNLVLFGAALLPIAVGAVIIDTTMTTRVQLDSAEDMRGRVLAARGIVTGGAGALGGPLLGWLCQFAGAGNALLLGGLVTTAVTAAVWLVFAKLPERRLVPEADRWERLLTPAAAASWAERTTPATSPGTVRAVLPGRGAGTREPATSPGTS